MNNIIEGGTRYRSKNSKNRNRKRVNVMDIDKRIKELEEIAHSNMSGGDIAEQLGSINPKLKKEYNNLMYGWD